MAKNRETTQKGTGGQAVRAGEGPTQEGRAGAGGRLRRSPRAGRRGLAKRSRRLKELFHKTVIQAS